MSSLDPVSSKRCQRRQQEPSFRLKLVFTDSSKLFQSTRLRCQVPLAQSQMEDDLVGGTNGVEPMSTYLELTIACL